jgi:hypothetical protein
MIHFRNDRHGHGGEGTVKRASPRADERAPLSTVPRAPRPLPIPQSKIGNQQLAAAKPLAQPGSAIGASALCPVPYPLPPQSVPTLSDLIRPYKFLPPPALVFRFPNRHRQSAIGNAPETGQLLIMSRTIVSGNSLPAVCLRSYSIFDTLRLRFILPPCAAIKSRLPADGMLLGLAGN